MTTGTTASPFALVPSLETAWRDVDSSFERFCLTAGVGALEEMLREDVEEVAGEPHSRVGAAGTTAGVRPKGRSAPRRQG